MKNTDRPEKLGTKRIKKKLKKELKTGLLKIKIGLSRAKLKTTLLKNIENTLLRVNMVYLPMNITHFFRSRTVNVKSVTLPQKKDFM